MPTTLREVPRFTAAIVPEREHPQYGEAQLQANAIFVCEARGFHGPFANTELYDHFGGVWSGMGDCRCCWNTRNVKAEQILQSYAEYSAEAA